MPYVKLSDGKYRIFLSKGKKLNGKRNRPSKVIESDLKGKQLEILNAIRMGVWRRD